MTSVAMPLENGDLAPPLPPALPPMTPLDAEKMRMLARKPPFDPFDESKVKWTRMGLWDFYEEIKPRFNFRDWLDSVWTSSVEMVSVMKHFVEFLRDILRHSKTQWLLVFYLVVVVSQSLLPAVVLWYSSETLRTIQAALENREIDYDRFYNIMGGTLLAHIGTELVGHADIFVTKRLKAAVSSEISARLLAVRLRLDLPTCEALERRILKMEDVDAWNTLYSVIRTLSILLELVSQCGVLAAVVMEHRSMVVFVLVSLAPSLIGFGPSSGLGAGTWAARIHDEVFIETKGIEQAAQEKKYKKEIMSNNLQEYFIAKWIKEFNLLGDMNHGIHEAYMLYRGYRDWRQGFITWSRLLSESLQLYQILKKPSTLPTAYAAFQLTRQVTSNVSSKFSYLKHSFGRMKESLNEVKEFFEVEKVENWVTDGDVPFPEDEKKLEVGVEIEFRDVSFKYPQADSYALKNVSFKVLQGQLCVIVGANGSGKSTMLKLLLRLYDPDEGQILINGIDIRLLKLADLRETISVLFQDFVLLPFSIKENIALGSPHSPRDMETIEQAAELAGATAVINRLPKKFDSHIAKPVYDCFHNLPPSTETLFGVKDISYGMPGTGWSREHHELSGGESQRLALARTFMRHIGKGSHVALLLYDEPSAALDPEAEYALFQRLIHLRGSKTMIFSSHRFGNLTKHANIILYMKESEVLEIGTHRELLKLGGGYASMYNIQADAFKSDDS